MQPGLHLHINRKQVKLQRVVPFRFVSFLFVSFRFVSFRFVSFRFVSSRFVSFRGKNRPTRRARELSLDDTRDSPFALLAKENDVMWGGGMPDDITVVALRVVDKADSQAAVSLAWDIALVSALFI